MFPTNSGDWVTMEEELECPICDERFDTEQRRPKVLHCGHTLCAQCINAVTTGSSIKCPSDREITRLGPHQLKDNYYLLSLLFKDPKRPRFWCVDCNKVACDSCEVVHAIKRLCRARYQQGAQDMQALEVLIAQQRERLDALVALGKQVSESVKRCSELGDEQLERAKRYLYRMTEWAQREDRDQEDWERIKVSANKAAASCRSKSLDQELQLLCQTEPLMVSLRVECSRLDGGWQGDNIDLHDAPELRLALLLLLHKNKLRLAGSSGSPGPAEPAEPARPAAEPANPAEAAEPKEPAKPAEEEQSQGDLCHEMLDLTFITKAEEKEMLLNQTKSVTEMKNLWCDSDPGWAVAMLEKHAPDLEDLRVFDVDGSHLRVVQNMPRLRRLEVWNWRLAMSKEPFVFEALPGAKHKLQWVEIWLPSKTVESLFYINRHSLHEIRLSVPVPDTMGVGEEDEWPQDSRDLAGILKRCDLHQLRTLTLLRFVYPCNGHPGCAAQLASARRVLPDTCYVECEECSR